MENLIIFLAGACIGWGSAFLTMLIYALYEENEWQELKNMDVTDPEKPN